MRRLLHPLLLLVVTGCARGELFVSPTSLSWGEVDFQQERPDDGYDPRDVVIRNDGERTIEVGIAGFDDGHLLLMASNLDQPLETGQQIVIRVSVWEYDVAAGERDTEVSGTFQVTAQGAAGPVGVDWSFTPVRDIDVDTGDFR